MFSLDVLLNKWKNIFKMKNQNMCDVCHMIMCIGNSYKTWSEWTALERDDYNCSLFNDAFSVSWKLTDVSEVLTASITVTIIEAVGTRET
jgi:hypothetical protein